MCLTLALATAAISYNETARRNLQDNPNAFPGRCDGTNDTNTMKGVEAISSQYIVVNMVNVAIYWTYSTALKFCIPVPCVIAEQHSYGIPLSLMIGTTTPMFT